MSTMLRQVAVGLLVIVAGCGEEARGGDPAPNAQPRQIIVALDLSGSQSAERRANARKSLDAVIDELHYGDRIVFIQVHQSAAAEESAARWSQSVPAPPPGQRETSLDRERLDGVKQAARSVAETMFARDSAGRLPTTDLFATLHIAAEFVRDGGSLPTAIVFLSDMLQSAHGIEMTRSAPPLSWIEQQRVQGVLPRLDRTCIAVIGADATTPLGVSVREFWKKYFSAAGATLPESNYRLISTDRPLSGCA